MPNLDGYDLTRAIRQAETDGMRRPIIAITANATKNEAQRCLDCGMDDYLSKPLRMAALDAMLTKWLPRSGPAQPPVAALPEPEAAEPGSVWDAHTLAALVGNNPPVIARLLKKYLVNAQQQVRDMQRAQASAELQPLGRLAHTLKSASRSTGALALGELCQALESAANSADAGRCAVLVQQLPAALDAAAGHINQFSISALHEHSTGSP
jgi:CheY-like chemotaxis protein